MVTIEEMLQVLPKFRGQEDLINSNQSIRNIVKEVLKAHEVFERHYDKMVDLWMTGNLAKVPDRLYSFCKRKLKYDEETQEDQTTRSPAGILEMRNVDCKHYSGFIAGVLDSINRTGDYYYDWSYRFASYDLLTFKPGHVFVIITDDQGEETWIDPVPEVPGFDARQPWPIYKWDKKVEDMALTRLSGIGSTASGFHGVNTVTRKSLYSSPACLRGIRASAPANALSGYRASIGAFTASQALPTVDTIQPVPSGYPSYLPNIVLTKDGKLLLKLKAGTLTLSDADYAWIQKALQPLIIKYAKSPYNIYWSIANWGSGKSYIHMALHPLFGSYQQIIDFLEKPNPPTGLDKFTIDLNTQLPALAALATNAVAPGAGVVAAALIASQTKGGSGSDSSIDLSSASTALPTSNIVTDGTVKGTILAFAQANPVVSILILGAVGYGAYELFKD